MPEEKLKTSLNYIEQIKQTPSEPLVVHSLGEYIEAISAINSINLKVYFRGQANEAWEVESSAYRHYYGLYSKGVAPDFLDEQMQMHNMNLIRDIKKLDALNDIADIVLEKDLYALAYCQHHGAKTNLIDFTSNPLIALWFACAGEKEQKKDAAVVYIENSFEMVNENSNLGDLLLPYKRSITPTIFIPPYFDRRIIAQQSILLLLPSGKMIAHEYRSVVIKAEAKPEILKKLREIGISRNVLFPDVTGFFEWYKSDNRDIICDLMAEAKQCNKGSAHTNALNIYLKCEQLALRAFGRKDVRLATIWGSIGEQYFELARYSDAIRYHLKALTLRNTYWGEDHMETAKSHSSLGANYRGQDLMKAALKHHEKAVSIRERDIEHNSRALGVTYNNLGFLYFYTGDYDKGIIYHEKALLSRIALYGELHRSVGASHHNLGQTLRAAGDFANAKKHLSKALGLRKIIFGENSTDYANTLREIGKLYIDEGEIETAIMEIKKSANILNNKPDSKGQLSLCYLYLGEAYTETGEYGLANKHLNQAMDIRAQLVKDNKSRIADIYVSLAKLQQKTNCIDDAIASIQITVDLYSKCFGRSSSKTKQAVALKKSLLKIKQTAFQGQNAFEFD